MKANTLSEQVCTETLKLVADFWTLRIIQSLEKGSLRYCELQRSIDNVNPTTLSKKLQTLENAGLLSRTEDKDGLAVSYRLTKLGTDALPVLHAVQAFSKRMA